MKTLSEIKLKIAEHEAKIDELLLDNIDIFVKIDLVDSYLIGRKALVWVLSNDQLLTHDDYEMRVRYEMSCIEATTIF